MTECDHSGGTSQELAGDGHTIETKCLACQAVLREPPVQQSLPSLALPEQEPAQPRQQAKPPAQQAASASKPINVLKLAKERLRVVKRELKAMRKLESEKAELERLIDAANGRPVAVVRDLRKRSG